MNVRSTTKLLLVALFLAAGGCTENASNNTATDPSTGQGMRDAPRMLFQTPVGEYADELVAPARLDYTASTVYVADPSAGAIVAVDRGSSVATAFPLAEGTPVGIATDGTDFYVALADGNVAVYDITFTAPTYLTGVDFVQPTDMAIGFGKLYIVDTGGDTIHVFDETTQAYLSSIGSRGHEGGQFKSPTSIAMDTLNSNIVVADQDNYRIQILGDGGTFLSAFGYRNRYLGDTPQTWFARSSGVAVDDGGFIYVVDGLLGTVRIYDQGGAELGEVLGHEDAFGGLSNPADIAIDSGALRLWIVNTDLAKVQVYETEPAGDLRNVVSTEYQAADIESGGIIRGWDPPHMEDDVSCSRCHDMDDQPTGDLSDAGGQANLCISCHTAAGQAAGVLLNTDGDNSHPWGVSAVDADAGSVGPDPDSPLADHLDSGNIRCGTCHDQHSETQGEPYMRVTLEGDSLLCAECHIQADQWVNAGHSDADSRSFTYPTGPGREDCATCHSGLGYIDFANGLPSTRLEAADGAVASGVLTSATVSAGGGWLEGFGVRLGDIVNIVSPSPSSARGTYSIAAVDNLNLTLNDPPADTAGLTFNVGTNQRTNPQVITCWVCHQTHGTDNPTIMRVYGEALMPGDVLVTGVDTSATCIVCHNGRRAPDDGSLTPHYALGGATLVGVNGNEFGCTIDHSFHGATPPSTTPSVLCAQCHMAATPDEGEEGHNTVGAHSFNIVDHDTGFENVENACWACHNGLPTVNRPAADYDGLNGPEGVQDEVQGLLDVVLPEIEAKGAIKLDHYPYWNLTNVGAPDLPLVEDAIWNWEFVDNDGSLGVHNTGYSVGLLQVTYLQLTGSNVPGTAILRYSCP